MRTLNTTINLNLLRRLAGAGAPEPDALARASAALWLEQARARAYLDAVADSAGNAASEPQTHRVRRTA